MLQYSNVWDWMLLLVAFLGRGVWVAGLMKLKNGVACYWPTESWPTCLSCWGTCCPCRGATVTPIWGLNQWLLLHKQCAVCDHNTPFAFPTGWHKPWHFVGIIWKANNCWFIALWGDMATHRIYMKKAVPPQNTHWAVIPLMWPAIAFFQYALSHQA